MQACKCLLFDICLLESCISHRLATIRPVADDRQANDIKKRSCDVLRSFFAQSMAKCCNSGFHVLCDVGWVSMVSE